MPREMFGDVVEPVDQGRDEAVVHGAAVDPGPRRRAGRADRHSAAGDRHAADAAVGDGVRGDAAAAAATAASAAATAGAAPPPQPVAVVNPNAAPVEAPEGNQARAAAAAQLQHDGRGRWRGRRHSGRRRRRHRRRHSAATASAAAAAPVRVGGDIKEPKKIKDVKPVYPPIAQTAKVQGIVIIEATIGKDGSVKDAKVLRASRAARPGRARRRQAVEVHADAAQRRAGGSPHDRHGELHAAVGRVARRAS